MKRTKAISSIVAAGMVLMALSVTGIASGTEAGIIGVGTEVPQFEAETYPVTIDGENPSEVKAEWQFSEADFSCDFASYSSGMVAATPVLTILPTYGSCKLKGALPVTLRTNGCSYLLSMSHIDGGTTGDIICPTGQVVEFLAYATETSQKNEFAPICKVTMGRQYDRNVEFYSAWGTYTLNSVEGLKYTYTRNSDFLCPKGEGTFETGTYTDGVEMTGSA